MLEYLSLTHVCPGLHESLMSPGHFAQGPAMERHQLQRNLDSGWANVTLGAQLTVPTFPCPPYINSIISMNTHIDARTQKPTHVTLPYVQAEMTCATRPESHAHPTFLEALRAVQGLRGWPGGLDIPNTSFFPYAYPRKPPFFFSRQHRHTIAHAAVSKEGAVCRHVPIL